MYCKQCGHEVKESAKFCGHCGAPVSLAATYPPSGEVSTASSSPRDIAAPKRSKRGLFLALLTLVIVGAAGGVYLYFSKGVSAIHAESTSSSVEPPEVSLGTLLGFEKPREMEYAVAKVTTTHTATGLVDTRTNTYDTEGRRIHTTWTSEWVDENTGDTIVGRTDESVTYLGGDDVSYKRVGLNEEDENENGTFYKSYHQVTNAMGDVIESVTEEFDGHVTTTKNTYEYYPSGDKKRIVITNSYDPPYDKEYTLFSKMIYEYDEDGNEVTAHTESIGGSIGDYIYEYDDNGNEVVCRFHYVSGDYVSDSVTEHTYDEFGNALSETENGTLREYQVNVDSKGHILRCEKPAYFETDGNGGTFGCREVDEYSYDEYGNMLWHKYTRYELSDDFDLNMEVDDLVSRDLDRETYLSYVRRLDTDIVSEDSYETYYTYIKV